MPQIGKLAPGVLISLLFVAPMFMFAVPATSAALLSSGLHNAGSTSTNWSGYAVTGASGSVTDVKGSWVVPAVSCGGRSSQYSSFWVGIDGFSSSTVEQTGTDSDCARGSASYYAWYEFYPNPSYVVPSFSVKPGNVITAEVSYTGSVFVATITDVTTHATFTTSAAVASAQRSSAEWIAEAPSSCGFRCTVLPLANFGTISFGSYYTGQAGTNYATVGGVTGTIGSFGSSVQSITMAANARTIKAQPSSLSTDGTSFTVAWHHS